MASALKILIIDDQIGQFDSPAQKTFLDKYCDLGYEFFFSTSEESPGYYTVFGALSDVEFHSDAALIILDIKFGSESDRLGVDILNEISQRYPSIPIIMMTSLEAEPATVVKCMRLGARDYISKSPSEEDLDFIIKKYARRVTQSNLILGNSSKIKELNALIEKVAQNANISVLIQGERGSGKELVARSIHYLSKRRNAPFIAVNCAAFPDSLLAAELFGAEKGAFTGADRTKYGYIELANDGILFLDEIGEMDPSVQALLLRVLETRKFRRVGVTKEEISVDLQLVCATNADIAQLVKQGKFRPDLYDRIKTLEIRTPSLREITDDIELLAKHALREICEGLGGTSYHSKEFTPEVIEIFKKYSWPGNVRQLRNAVESAMIHSTGRQQIQLSDIPSDISGTTLSQSEKKSLPPEGIDLNYKLAELELSYLQEAYHNTGENKARTMQLYYPGCPANYFDRIIYNAVLRAPCVLEKFPKFQRFYDKENARRISKS